jgi:adhesin transport system membrane fusion protein
MSKDLLASKLVPKMEHLELEDEVTLLRAEADELSKRLPNLRAAYAEARERERTGLINFQRAVIEELQQVELSIARNRELITKIGDQSSRREIRSPIDGIVKNLRYHTVGGVVRPGEAIMEIVPSDENLVVELNLNPVDVGYVRVSQSAVVKVTSFDFVCYGGLESKVINIAPDSSIQQDGTAYFRVMVETSKDYLGDKPGVNRIIPGMLATGDIHTGYRSVLDYFIAPVLKLKHEAFRER